jgi:hypothetical protein
LTEIFGDATKKKKANVGVVHEKIEYGVTLTGVGVKFVNRKQVSRVIGCLSVCESDTTKVMVFSKVTRRN